MIKGENAKKSRGKRARQQFKTPTAVTLGGVPAVDLGTGELLPREEVQALVKYAKTYDLDPRRGHVVFMYSLPYITLDGYLYHANRSEQGYQLHSRPLTDEERSTYQVEDGSHAWVSEIIMDYGRRSFIGLGIVTLEEMEARSKRDSIKLALPVVAKHPWQLAQKRADWQALHRAFPIGETPEGEED